MDRQIELVPDKTGVFAQPESRYVIEAAVKTLRVLETLEATVGERSGLKIKSVSAETGFSKDFCLRALHTLRAAGFAVEDATGWRAAPKICRFAETYQQFAMVVLAGRP